MSYESPGARLRRLWAQLSPLPGGRWLFSKLLGLIVPYTGRLGPTVVLFEPGHVQARLKERWGVRNHLRSVHAMALANLGELATGLAVLGAMPSSVRGIVTGFEITYSKKARGLLTVEAKCEIPEVTDSIDYRVEAVIRDEEGDAVATVNAVWLLGPVKPKE
jgi:acyl-coenzyme A thioesterase PaaI-like protein